MNKITHSILIIGKISSGKTSLINALAKQFDIPITSFGKMIKEKIKKTNDNSNRENLQNLGHKIFSADGAKKITDDALEFSNNMTSKSIIFDGVRHKSVLDEIKKNSENTIVIYLNVDEMTLFSRYKQRTKPDLKLEEFQKINNHPIEQGIDDMKYLSDFIIDSTQSKEIVFDDVKEKIEKFLKV